MKRRIYIIFVMLHTLLVYAPVLHAQAVDHLGVAAVLIRDGNYERAMSSLEKVDLENKDIDVSRYYTLLGLVQLRNGLFSQALESFNTAINQGQDDPVVYAYIAQGHFALEQYPEAIRAINQLPSMNQFPDLYGMKSQAFWLLGNISQAFAVLEKGISVFPGKKEFLHQKIIYLLDLELNQEAGDVSKEYLKLLDVEDSESYISISQALLKSGEKDQAVLIMEIARLRYSDNMRIRLGLAQSYAGKQQFYTAAKLVEEAALYNPEMYSEAAELYRRAGKLNRALYINSLVLDPKKKVTQRFNILLDRHQYENAFALETRMKRLGVFENEGFSYAMAYVMFQLQKYDESIAYLNTISSNELFREATQLRQAIEIMKNEPFLFFNRSVR